MNKYEYANENLKKLFTIVMNELQDEIESWGSDEVTSICIKSSLRSIQCKVESAFNSIQSNILKAEHDELEDMINQFYGQVMAACGKDGE